MRSRRKNSKFKSVVAHGTKKVRSWHAKQPILVTGIGILLGLLMVGGGSSGIYHLATQSSDVTSNELSEITTIGEFEGLHGTADTDQADKSPTEDSNTSTDEAANPSRESSSSPSAEGSEASEDSGADSLVSTVSSIKLGGAEPSGPRGADIRSASGKKITPLIISTSPSRDGAASNLHLDGIRVYESATTDGTNFHELSRSLNVSLSDPLSSGNITVYVFANHGIKPVAIRISWSPAPTYSMEKTNQDYATDGDTETYTLKFRLTPNAHFGTPKLNFRLSSTSSRACVSGSTESILTTYNGTRNFSLVCTRVIPPCSNVCPIGSTTTFRVNASAQTPGGYYIPGVSTTLTYHFPS